MDPDSSDPSPAPLITPAVPSVRDDSSGVSAMSAFSRITSGFGLRLPLQKEGVESSAASAQGSVLESFTKGIVDSSRNAVKAVQVKARHMVSQNKRRYQEGGFDLDMTYITENIIAMGFPSGDISSGLFGYFEGLYRNHMEEVIKFFETHHKGKYKVYNLCSERLYDASLFEGKVACFPFDDHNCPPIQLILSFCQSAYSWLKEDILNVVVVHCKAGMARTGLMICSLLLYLKFFPTAEEAIDYYNQKRCVDGKALVLPSQIRYVKYFERTLMNFNGVVPTGRRCMLRGFRLYRCPFWIRPSITVSNHNGILFSTKKHPKTKDLMPEDFWMKSQKKGIMVFAIPGERGLTELVGDFKVHFHDRQGDFYCWLNTSMMENRVLLKTSDIDGFDKRKLPSPGFHVEVVMIDADGSLPPSSNASSSGEGPDGNSSSASFSKGGVASSNHRSKASVSEDNDNVFSDSDEDEKENNKGTEIRVDSGVKPTGPSHIANSNAERAESIISATNKVSIGSEETSQVNASKEATAAGVSKSTTGLDCSIAGSDIKAMAADASVFTFGDEEDYESE